MSAGGRISVPRLAALAILWSLSSSAVGAQTLATEGLAAPFAAAVSAALRDELASRPLDTLDPQPAPPDPTTPERINWKGTLLQSGLLLGTQHSLRMLQQKTREHLGGPFWHDYVESVRGLRGWDDGNPFITNYLGHPLMGGIAGFIQIQNDPAGIALEWDPGNRAYWSSRLKAMGWAAVYSTNFELAPWGEAGIGNVGYDPGTMAYVDLVVTPLAGFGMVLLEDYLDARVIARLEAERDGQPRRVLRVLLNPQRSFANLMRFERPSHRDTRP